MNIQPVAVKKMLIDGVWTAARSGRTFDTFNPATGERLASLPYGSAEDVDLAVAAARRAFEGEWSRLKPFDRQAILLRIADLFERYWEEISITDTLEVAPVPRSKRY